MYFNTPILSKTSQFCLGPRTEVLKQEMEQLQNSRFAVPPYEGADEFAEQDEHEEGSQTIPGEPFPFPLNVLDDEHGENEEGSETVPDESLAALPVTPPHGSLLDTDTLEQDGTGLVDDVYGSPQREATTPSDTEVNRFFGEPQLAIMV